MWFINDLSIKSIFLVIFFFSSFSFIFRSFRSFWIAFAIFCFFLLFFWSSSTGILFLSIRLSIKSEWIQTVTMAPFASHLRYFLSNKNKEKSNVETLCFLFYLFICGQCAHESTLNRRSHISYHMKRHSVQLRIDARAITIS